MAMHLIDRPHLEIERLGDRGMSAVGSAALHALLVLALVALMRMSGDERVTAPIDALLPDRLVWIPSVAVGGGRDSGGQRAPDPPRLARAIGAAAISVPASPETHSTQSIIEPPPDVQAIPARPMGDATLVLAGTVDSSGTSAGPGDSGTGKTPGSNQGGLGNQPSEGFGHGASRGGPGVTMPTLVERVAPKYTVDAMRAGVQGSVWIECVVMPDGSVGDARVARSLDRRFGLDDEAIAAAKRWRFRPGRIDGQPVAVVVSIELMFSVR
jgi:periplasmic protein TonB